MRSTTSGGNAGSARELRSSTTSLHAGDRSDPLGRRQAVGNVLQPLVARHRRSATKCSYGSKRQSKPKCSKPMEGLEPWEVAELHHIQAMQDSNFGPSFGVGLLHRYFRKPRQLPPDPAHTDDAAMGTSLPDDAGRDLHLIAQEIGECALHQARAGEGATQPGLAAMDSFLPNDVEFDLQLHTEACECGNVFKLESLFCRKCGKRRGAAAADSSLPKDSMTTPVHGANCTAPSLADEAMTLPAMAPLTPPWTPPLSVRGGSGRTQTQSVGRYETPIRTCSGSIEQYDQSS